MFKNYSYQIRLAEIEFITPTKLNLIRNFHVLIYVEPEPTLGLVLDTTKYLLIVFVGRLIHL